MPWPTLCIVVLALFLLTAFVCLYLVTSLRSLQGRHAELLATADESRRAADTYMDELVAARDKLARLETELTQERVHFEQRLEDLRKAEAKLGDTFKALSGNVLKDAQEQFLALAKERLGGQHKDAQAQLDQRKAAIENLLKPIEKSLKQHGEAVTRIEKEREGSYHALRQQIASMQQAQGELRSETANLVKALRRPEVRGRWGEVQLRRVAELAGMIPHCDFDEQESVDTADARQRPDMVVKLPAGRTIVVDAKTPISAFVEAIECDVEADRERALQSHLRQMKQKVTDLSSKGYQAQFDRSPDFVVLFIPGESFLQAAVEREPGLIEWAMNLGVVIATPSTLIALLKAVEMGWREQRIAESAQQVQDLGVELHERLATVVKHFATVGTHLDRAVEAYNKTSGSIESRLLVTARKFKELGADSKKELPGEGALPTVEVKPRRVTADEA